MKHRAAAPRLVMDLGASKLAWLLDFGTQGQEIGYAPLPELGDPMAELDAATAQLLSSTATLSGVVVVVAPTILDGAIEAWPNRPHWVGFPIADELQRLLGVPVSFLPDGDAAAIADVSILPNHGGVHISLFFGSGVAGGVLIDGEPVRFGTFATELGHIVTDPGGHLCRCGDRGCIQAAWIAFRNGEDGLEAFGTQLSRLMRMLARVFPGCHIVLGGRFVENEPDIAKELLVQVQAATGNALWWPQIRLSENGPHSPLIGGLLVARRRERNYHVS